MTETSADKNLLTQKAIKSNLVVQNALTAQAARLEAQLKELDELIAGLDQDVTTEEVPDASEGEFQIPGSKRAIGPIPSFELLSQESPFYKEASQRAQYLRWTTVRPIKGKEAEVLADAVKKENMRLEAYRARDNPTAPPINILNNVQGINWLIVAEKASDQSNNKRTPDECRISWVGNLHPNVNHGDWTQEELNKLHDLTANELAAGGKVNWAGVVKDLATNRTPVDCMKHATTRPRHHWDNFFDQKLREAVQIFGTNNWNLVARHVSPYTTTSQCQTRYVRTVDPGIKRGTWSSEENERLRKAIAAFGNSWIDVAGVLPGRTNEQCRERWSEVTSSHGGKGEWSIEEEEMLLHLVKELGNKWKAISTKIGGGKTGPHCRLRYDKLIRARAKQAEEAFIATHASRVSPPPVGPVTPSTTILQEAKALVPTPTKPKSRRKKSKATPSFVDDDTRVTRREVMTAQQPVQEEPVEPVPPKPRPRPRPRVTYQGKGKEKAANDDIPNEREAGSEQLVSSSQALVESSSVPSEALSQTRLIQQSELQVGPLELASSSIVAATTAREPRPENDFDVQPTARKSVGDAELQQDRSHLQIPGAISLCMELGLEELHDTANANARRRGKRQRDDNSDTEAPDEVAHLTGPRKRRTMVAGNGDTQPEPGTECHEARKQGNAVSDAQISIEGGNVDTKATNRGDAAIEVSTRGRGRGRGRGSTRGGGRGRARGRRKGATSAVISEGDTAAVQENLAEGNQVAPDVPLQLLVPAAAKHGFVPADAHGAPGADTPSQSNVDQTSGGSRGQSGGGDRGYGRGVGDSPTDSPPLRRSTRTTPLRLT